LNVNSVMHSGGRKQERATRKRSQPGNVLRIHASA
jgi:hypothetical protein